jgi:Arc/MetJ-type ribon-helix-helix transcriptional regulator
MKAARHNPVSNPACVQPVSDKEWDFKAVPKEELEACFLYEYSREYFKRSSVLRELRELWRQYHEWRNANRRRKWDSPISRKKELGLLAHEHIERILAARLGYSTPFDLRTFPDLPWQDMQNLPKPRDWVIRQAISQAAQRRQKQKSRSDRLHIETLAQLEPPNIKTLDDFIHYHDFFHRDRSRSNTEYGFFAIDWSYPEPEIRKAFCEWLKERAGKRCQSPGVIRASRGQAADKLNWLGAFRIRKHYRKRALVEYVDSRLKVRAPYSHYPDLVKAGNKAKDLIARLFPSEVEAAKIEAQPFEYRPPTVPIKAPALKAG